jgi:hypothetical protein
MSLISLRIPLDSGAMRKRTGKKWVSAQSPAVLVLLLVTLVCTLFDEVVLWYSLSSYQGRSGKKKKRARPVI